MPASSAGEDMSYCTACGQPRAGAAPFCAACGAPLVGPPAGPGPGEPGGPPDDDFFNYLFRPDPVPARTGQTRPIPAPLGAGPDRAGFGLPPRSRPGTAGRGIVLLVG